MRFDFDLPKVVHAPMCPPRKCTPGEGIYLDLWREFATARPHDWRAIFDTKGPVRQRAASVAASFMVYMGCNWGRDFTDRAEKLASVPGLFWGREQAFVAAWAVENRRVHGMNHGLRASEYMLATRHPIQDRPGRSIDWDALPTITAEDNDILESMAAWWGTGPAGVMREIAKPMIEAATKKMSADMFTREAAA